MQQTVDASPLEESKWNHKIGYRKTKHWRQSCFALIFSSSGYSTSLTCRRTGLLVSLFALPHSVHILYISWKMKGFKCTGEGELHDYSRMLCSRVADGMWYQLGRWGKHLSKGVVLIEGREQIISLVLVIFPYARISLQLPWQELLYWWR